MPEIELDNFYAEMCYSSELFLYFLLQQRIMYYLPVPMDRPLLLERRMVLEFITFSGEKKEHFLRSRFKEYGKSDVCLVMTYSYI